MKKLVINMVNHSLTCFGDDVDEMHDKIMAEIDNGTPSMTLNFGGIEGGKRKCSIVLAQVIFLDVVDEQ